MNYWDYVRSISVISFEFYFSKRYPTILQYDVIRLSVTLTLSTSWYLLVSAVLHVLSTYVCIHLCIFPVSVFLSSLLSPSLHQKSRCLWCHATNHTLSFSSIFHQSIPGTALSSSLNHHWVGGVGSMRTLEVICLALKRRTRAGWGRTVGLGGFGQWIGFDMHGRQKYIKKFLFSNPSWHSEPTTTQPNSMVLIGNIQRMLNKVNIHTWLK